MRRSRTSFGRTSGRTLEKETDIMNVQFQPAISQVNTCGRPRPTSYSKPNGHAERVRAIPTDRKRATYPPSPLVALNGCSRGRATPDGLPGAGAALPSRDILERDLAAHAPTANSAERDGRREPVAELMVVRQWCQWRLTSRPSATPTRLGEPARGSHPRGPSVRSSRPSLVVKSSPQADS